MTAAVYRSGTPALAVPPTQNTAPVLEFNCLYTHDVRRKQKRWQDGFLRFHTFNKRVMVYDVPRNFIGDMHWKDGDELHDGDEIMLEKGGVLVQVAEQIGRSETDLTELRKSKNKNLSEHGSSSPVRAGRPLPPQNPGATASRPATHLKHRSLNALLGTPKGVIGKAALPTKSPFEQRHADVENDEWAEERPLKKRRVEAAPACNVTRNMTNPTPAREKETSLWARTADSANQKKKNQVQAAQQRIGTREMVDLTADLDESDRFLPGFSSDALAPSSPPKPAAPVPAQPAVRSSSPAFQTMNLPAGNLRRQRPEPTMSEALPTTAQVRNPEDVAPPLPQLQTKSEQQPKPAHSEENQSHLSHASELQPFESLRPLSNRGGQTLRMAASAPKKKTLLCQDQLTTKPSRKHSASTELGIDALSGANSQNDTTSTKKQPKSQRLRLQERLDRIGKKKGLPSDVNEDVHGELEKSSDQDVNLQEDRPQTPLEANMLELARLDQMIMPPEQPPSPAPVEPIQAGRQLRRVVSESHDIASTRPKRIPGAPVRFTPSPKKKSPTPVPMNAAQIYLPSKSKSSMPKPRAKKPNQRAVSLNTGSDGTSAVILGKPFQTPKAPKPDKIAASEKPADPWSREAFDLFTWRPPGWDEEGWCVQVESAGG